jgi:ABC-type thiamine transport system substrate-binding protein
MATYRINPAGVEAALKKTQTDAEEFGTILKPLEGYVESTATATGGSGAVVPALQAFFEQQGTHLDAINTRVSAALTGAYNATKAYVDGDLDMVMQYQAAAAASVDPRPVGGHGRATAN